MFKPGQACYEGSGTGRRSEGDDIKRFATYEDFSRYLDELGLFHMNLALSRVENSLQALGLDTLPYAAAQVVGSNGKGSTSAYLAGLARAQGVRAGLYTSPHFLTPRERIRINGAMLDREQWTALANTVYAAKGDALTYFEFLTVLAALAFAEAGVELAVFEAGLGGRYDATSALDCSLLLLTTVSLEHTAVLGNTVEAIARDKAGAIRPGCTVLASDGLAAGHIFQERAEQVGARLLSASEVSGVQEALLAEATPPHQQNNQRLALAAWETVARENAWATAMNQAERATILAQSALPGRMQWIPARAGKHPCLLLDGAHTPEGFEALAQSLALAGARPEAVVFTCMKDKDVATISGQVLGLGKGPVLVPTLAHNPRAMDPGQLAEKLGPRARAVESMAAALEEALNTVRDRTGKEDGLALICGSLYVLAEVYALYPEYLQR